MSPLTLKLFKHKKIIAVIIAVVIYFTLTYATNEQQMAYEKEVVALDTNKDGIYSDDEVNEEQKQIIEKMENGTGGRIAPFTLVPFAFFCGIFVFFTLRAVENYTTKKAR